MEFKVGNRYKVLQGCSTFTTGSEVELERLSLEDSCHLFRLITGSCGASIAAGGKPGSYISETNVEPLESRMSRTKEVSDTDRSYQTTDELIQENKSLQSQIKKLIHRQLAMSKEFDSLGDRIKRKKAFRTSNIQALKSQSVGV